MSVPSRIGAACLVVGSLVGLVSVLIEPTVSEKGADQAAAVVGHLTALQTGLAINAIAAVLVAAGLVWLAWVTYPRSRWLALAGGALGVLGLFAAMLDDGLSVAGASVAQGLGSAQATALLDRLFTGGNTAVGIVSGLHDVGIILLGVAAVRAGVPRWGSATIIVGAVVDVVGFASGQHYIAAVGFALMTIGFASAVRTFSAAASSVPARAVSAQPA